VEENKKSKTNTDRTTGGRKWEDEEEEEEEREEGRGRRGRMCARRERTLVKKRRNIKDSENKKEKRDAVYVINSDKFHRTQ
jgi:hypothetical protein